MATIDTESAEAIRLAAAREFRDSIPSVRMKCHLPHSITNPKV
ncbi:hypothetical protein [Pseudarthrobacter sp. H2]